MESLVHAFGLDWRIVLAQVVNFGIVFAFVWFIAYKPLVAFLDKRQTLIREGVERAERAESVEQGAHQKAREVIASAEGEAARITESATALANKTHETALREADMRKVALLHDAEKEARARGERIQREAEEEVLRSATLLAEKVIKERYEYHVRKGA